MRRITIALLLLALLLALTVVPTFAKVDVVSQAGCGNSAESGAKNSSDNTPAFPIPESARGSELPGRGGGDGDPECDVK